MKKVRRGKSVKNVLKNLKLYYNNLRGIKSKLISLAEILEKVKPHVICLNETKLGEDERVSIEGYEPYHCNNKKGEGGIFLEYLKR